MAKTKRKRGDDPGRRQQQGAPPPKPDAERPDPQPEHEEPDLRDPGPTELSKRDYVAIFKRAGKESLDDQIPDLAAGLAYRAFLAIPSILLVSVGVFALVADPQSITRLMEEVGRVAPAEVVTLLEDSLNNVVENQQGGLVMILFGGALALWAATSAMNSVQRALNRAYEREETRGFLRQRLAALAMLAASLLAALLVFGLLVLGPALSGWIGSALGMETVFSWIWWTAQWPLLVGGLLLAFAAILYFGPNVDHPRWQFLSFGSVVAVVVWLLASGAFAIYVSQFGSYNKTWGSLAAVIIMLTWLWLSALVLLFGAELNAEAERSRELRRGQPAEDQLQAPAKA